MMTMSLLIGAASVLTSYYWWTDDWWRPATITGTKVGVEDFIAGFTSGGIMATLYEFLFKKTIYHKVKTFNHQGLITLVLLTVITEFLLKSFGMTSFYASTIAMLLVVGCMLAMRRDLFVSSVLSALLMTVVSFLPYLLILLIHPDWIQRTYLPTLSGISLIGVPIEEFVFWFMSGLLFGPFYEYWKGEKLRKLR